MERISAARAWRERNRTGFENSPPIRNSDYFEHLPDYLSWAPDPLVPTARVSGRDQFYKRNLDSQERGLVETIAASGLPPIVPIREICSGWRFDNRGRLELAAKRAREIGGGILWESVSRALRPFDFKHDDPELAGAPIRLAEMELFLSIVGNIPLVTVLHPDADWREVRSYETKRGLSSRRDDARPPGYKKAIRAELAPRARELRAMGWTVADIVEELKRPRRTIYRWI